MYQEKLKTTSQTQNGSFTVPPGKARVKTISKQVESQLEPIDLFDGLSSQFSLTNNMLLESSEIDSKENVKSILMLKAALRIECNQNQIVIQALTPNGESAIEIISPALKQSEFVKCICHEKTVIAIEFHKNSNTLDEDSRLKQPSPVDVLRLIKTRFQSSNDSEFSLFLCGLFAFDFIATFESLPVVEDGVNSCPDFVFYLAETLLLIDHKRNNKRLVSNQFVETEEKDSVYYELARDFESFESAIKALEMRPEITKKTAIKGQSVLDEETVVTCDLDDEAYQQVVAQLKQNIIDGDIFQVVPSRTFSLKCHSPIESYRCLKKANPSPYMFYMQDQDFCLFGASPESALKYTQSTNDVLLYPIAGTRPRGLTSVGEIDLDLDARIEAELKLDEKEIAEHMMLVDLARNDISRIAEAGTTYVPRLLAVDRYSQVMHLVSCVQGKLRSDLDSLHAYQACMNMGTLTGAPKVKASTLIRQVEKKRRGSYGGAVGYFNGQGDMDTCIVIRSAFYKDGVAHIQAGAGVVYDSIPTLEAEETANKAKAVINAILLANNGIATNSTEGKS